MPALTTHRGPCLASRSAIPGHAVVAGPLRPHQPHHPGDRVVFGEISTHNAGCALSALNSGISGFLCTIHAESPKQVINRKFDQVMAFSGQARPQLDRYLGELLDMVIQIRRGEGARFVSEIYLPKTGQWLMGEET